MSRAKPGHVETYFVSPKTLDGAVEQFAEQMGRRKKDVLTEAVEQGLRVLMLRELVHRDATTAGKSTSPNMNPTPAAPQVSSQADVSVPAPAAPGERDGAVHGGDAPLTFVGTGPITFVGTGSINLVGTDDATPPDTVA
jgi:hypothetical protein